MATPPPVTDTMVRFVIETDFAVISDQTRANAKMHILDTLGVALAGVEQPAAAIALDYCRRLGSSNEASDLGHAIKCIGVDGGIRQWSFCPRARL